MIATTIICAFIFKFKLDVLKKPFKVSLKQIVPILFSTSSFVGMAEAMKTFGMMSTIAEAVAILAGDYFPFVSPIVGMLGCVATGSSSASNIFFRDFQVEVADKLGLSKLAIATTQSIGSTAGELLSPPNATVIVTPLGMKGDEGIAIKRNIPSSIIYLIIAGALSYLFILLI